MCAISCIWCVTREAKCLPAAEDAPECVASTRGLVACLQSTLFVSVAINPAPGDTIASKFSYAGHFKSMLVNAATGHITGFPNQMRGKITYDMK